MKKLDALFLQDIWNLASLKFTKARKYEGKTFSQCTTRWLVESGWTEKEQSARFRSLKKMGFIETRKEGMPPCRWVRVNLAEIESALDQSPPNGGHWQSPPNGRQARPPNGGQHDSQTGANTIRNKYRNKKKQGPLGADRVSPSEWAFSTARSLLDGLRKKGKVLRQPNLRNWAVEMDELTVEVRRQKSIEHDRAQKKIQKMIPLHLENLEDRYWPKAYSAAAFREKFIAITEAEARIKEPEVEWGAYGNDGTLRFKRRNKTTDAEMEDFSWYPLIGGVKVNGEQRRQLLEAK